MAILGLPGLGTTLSNSATSGGSYTPVAQVKGIGGVDMEVVMQESTGLSSVAAEVLPTIFKGGEVPFTVVYNPADATHASLWTDFKAKTLKYWKLALPAPIGPGATGSAMTIAFAAYLSGMSIGEVSPEGIVETELKLSITGDVTIS